jgi:hypothetical protein
LITKSRSGEGPIPVGKFRGRERAWSSSTVLTGPNELMLPRPFIGTVAE